MTTDVTIYNALFLLWEWFEMMWSASDIMLVRVVKVTKLYSQGCFTTCPSITWRCRGTVSGSIFHLVSYLMNKCKIQVTIFHMVEKEKISNCSVRVVADIGGIWYYVLAAGLSYQRGKYFPIDARGTVVFTLYKWLVVACIQGWLELHSRVFLPGRLHRHLIRIL